MLSHSLRVCSLGFCCRRLWLVLFSFFFLLGVPVHADLSMYRLKEERAFDEQFKRRLEEAYQQKIEARKKNAQRVQKVLEQSRRSYSQQVSVSSTVSERARAVEQKRREVDRARSLKKLWISLASFLGLAVWAFWVHKGFGGDVSQK